MKSAAIQAIDDRFEVFRLDGNAINDMLFTEEKVQNNRRFVRHSNKICTGPGPCTFSLYRTQDNTAMGSCINTFNFHISGNYMEFCISRAVVELDIMKSNPKKLYPVTIPITTQHNTCTTVDLPGILNPQTALSRAKMVWDATSVPIPKLGLAKTTSFPAYNVYVRYLSEDHDFPQNSMPPTQPMSCRSNKRPFQDVQATGESDADTQECKPPVSKRSRAYAVFDDRGIVCDAQRYTGLQMKHMMKRSVSWEFHKNNINTSYFQGKALATRLREVLSWYLGQDGVEFDSKKQNFIASIEKEACALLPCSVLLLAEIEYIMRFTQTAGELNVRELFLSRSMICTYGTFSRGNAYTPLISKSVLNYISGQYKLQPLHDRFRMNEAVLCELFKMDRVDMGQVRTQVKRFLARKKSDMALCSSRSRSEGMLSSLMYGPEYFVRRVLQALPSVLKTLKLSLKEGSDSKYFASILEGNYGSSH